MTTTPEGAEEPLTTGTFESLIPAVWFTRPEDSSVWVRIYTCLFVPMDKLIEAIREWPGFQSTLPEATSIAMGFGTVTGFKFPAQNVDIYSQTSGTVIFAVRVNEKTLPDATYLFLLAPFRVDGKPGDEPAVRKRLDELCGLFCVHAGRNLLRECVFEGEVEAKGGKMHVPGPPQKTPQPTEGPYLGVQNGGDIVEISQGLAKMPEPKKSRLKLSLRLMNTAMREDEGFFEYWTALEVVCDGKGGRILDRFRTIYGLKSHKEAADRGGLGVLSRWRGEYVHKGHAPHLTIDVERYIQLVFLDLLRHELGLPPRHHAAGMHRARGFDLSPLGLSDNRTEEQKAARRAAEQASRGTSPGPA